MELLGSSIYVTSTFYRFVFDGVCLVHWTHSFSYLHNTTGKQILQDGMFHKKYCKKLEIMSMDSYIVNML